MSRQSYYLTGAIFMLLVSVASAQTQQETFATPNEAASALLQSLKSHDLERLRAIFGPDAAQVISSGDPVQDKHDRELLTVAMEQSWRWVQRGGNARELIVGHESWPFPIPLMRQQEGWRFDTKAGGQEVLARRVGRNELAVIKICQAYVNAQNSYASEGHDGKGPGIYAQKIRSEPGRQDGLYWTVMAGEKLSPIGDLAAQAEAEGYDRVKNPTAPIHGYYFRILTGQGAAARGGAKSYIIGGDMSQGFALLAYPASYRISGVMTFMINQDAVVYEKDLGQETARLASETKEFNPDKSWRKVNPVP